MPADLSSATICPKETSFFDRYGLTEGAAFGEERTRAARAALLKNECPGALELDLYEGHRLVAIVHNVALDAGGPMIGLTCGQVCFRHARAIVDADNGVGEHYHYVWPLMPVMSRNRAWA